MMKSSYVTKEAGIYLLPADSGDSSVKGDGVENRVRHLLRGKTFSKKRLKQVLGIYVILARIKVVL